MYKILEFVLLINLIGYNLGFPNSETSDGLTILTGRTANEMEFPFIVSIQHTSSEGKVEKFCGGSVLRRNWILTAAHCFDTLGIEEVFHVRTSLIDSYDTHQDSEVLKVKKVILHPDYESGKPHDDIALLLLEQLIDLSPSVQPIFLPHGNTPIVNGDLIGWGTVDTKQTQPSQYLMVIDQMPSSESTECSTIFPEFNPETMFCVGANANKNACAVDSARIFIQYEGVFHKPTIRGIAPSLGANECDERPIVLTNVRPYVSFIMRTMRTNH